MSDKEAVRQAVNTFRLLSDENVAKLQALHAAVDSHQGDWSVQKGGEENADGSRDMPWVENDPLINDFIHFMYDTDLMIVFDWTDWEAGSQLFTSDEPTKFDALDLETTLKLITLIIRKGRFVEGMIARTFESGDLPKLIDRLAVLQRS